ncbi:hypothetical protein TD95_001703 [Thielaviopsis punctulata]|uniref:Homeobox domain-containing protein n=1 Tax=Thielaviopsis punctulata TaxID=72032 RepID=A0A0F4Z8D4_9PEZI|nr:hypothetical protein TD95_001703 [Thielaviopsis punctulata]
MSYNRHYYHHSQGLPQEVPQQSRQAPPPSRYQERYHSAYEQQQSPPLLPHHYGQHPQPQYYQPPSHLPQNCYQQPQCPPQPHYIPPPVPGSSSQSQQQQQQQQRPPSESYVTLRSRNPGLETNPAHYEPLPSSPGPRSATHDVGRVAYHIKHVGHFAKTLEESAAKAFPNKGRSTQRYTKVHALLLHWRSDDLFVLPELEDLEKCLKHDYAFDTSIFPIPNENPHLDLMLRIGQLIKDHESPDTLFVVYYGGHARIDDSRQSRWCATRNPDSPWLQWSAIQTLLERSISDVLILLDCCAGAASATFPTSTSITETISASSWDAIAPDPGRYSFTTTLIEVLQAWRGRTFSAAMLHAEVLARLKHPRPILQNGTHREARSTPVHFMMTANHKAPSIEITKLLPTNPSSAIIPTSPPVPSLYSSPQSSHVSVTHSDLAGLGRSQNMSYSDQPTEDVPHVMISLALEDNQDLDLNAWEQWLADFPAMAKYVKVQGAFKSHSNLLLVSMPVMIWDMLPEDCATNFVAFIRSNNLVMKKPQKEAVRVTAPVDHQSQASVSSTLNDDMTLWGDSSTLTPTLRTGISQPEAQPSITTPLEKVRPIGTQRTIPTNTFSSIAQTSSTNGQSPASATSSSKASPEITRKLIYNQHRTMRRTTFAAENVPKPPKFARHVESRLEHYYRATKTPNDADREFIASNLGIDSFDIEAWFHHQREKDTIAQQTSAMELTEEADDGPIMVLPTDLDVLLDICLPGEEVVTIDLRSKAEFAKGHVFKAINLRAPLSFLSKASLEAVDELLDNESRKLFTWKAVPCVVYYADNTCYEWECPAAAQLHSIMRSWGWRGHSFILQGIFADFASTFPKYIVTTPALSAEAAGYIERLSEPVAFPKQASHERSLRLQQHIDKCKSAHFDIVQKSVLQNIDEKRRAVEHNEEILEKEFRMRRTKSSRTSDNEPLMGQGTTITLNARREQLAEYLDRSIARLRQTSNSNELALPSSSSSISSIAIHKAHIAQEISGIHPTLSPQTVEATSQGVGVTALAVMLPVERPHSNSSFVEVSKSEDLAGMAKEESTRKNGRGGGSGGNSISGGFLNKMLRRS